MKIVAFLVAYDRERYNAAKAELSRYLIRLGLNFRIVCISNSRLLDAELRGTNACGEFSGWAEALLTVDVYNYNYFIFANDTFYKHEFFGPSSFVWNKFLESSRPSIMGEIAVSLNFQDGNFLPRSIVTWIRSSFFVLNRTGLLTLEHVWDKPLTDAELFFFKNDTLMADPRVPVEFQHRIIAWLDVSNQAMTWHGLKVASEERILLKANCVLQELNLFRRCEKLGLSIFDFGNRSLKDRVKVWLLNKSSFFRGALKN